MNIINFAIALFGIGLNAAAQIFLKLGVEKVDFDQVAKMNMPDKLFAFIEWPFMLGLTCYAISFCVWIVVLKRMELSMAYPLLSIGFIVSLFAGHLMFGEQITMIRILGVVLICLGVIFVSRS
jgi:multidrug transporter EmrE-like cation transporter